jgi:hypothetical protein
MPAAAQGRTRSRTRTGRRAPRGGALVRWDPKPTPAGRRGVTTGAAIMAKATRPARPKTEPIEDPCIQRLAQPFEDMPLDFRQLIQQEDPVVGPRHLPRPRHRPAADQAGIREGVMGEATRARGDGGDVGAGAARDAREARGLKGLRQGQRRQDGGEPARQHLS